MTQTNDTQTIRAITLVYRSHVDDSAWLTMIEEIVEVAEQAACDFAAACANDDYELQVAVS